MFSVLKWTEEQLQLHEDLYRQTVEAGGQIIPLADAQMQKSLKTQLVGLKETWEPSRDLVQKRKAFAHTITQVCGQFFFKSPRPQ